ncbi:MAG: hypothetical protein AAFR75_12150, partial [Pseudomonadota bacterium]
MSIEVVADKGFKRPTPVATKIPVSTYRQSESSTMPTKKPGQGAIGPTGGQRQLRVRVKTARKRSNSSARWLERQLNDPYVAASKRDGMRSR